MVFGLPRWVGVSLLVVGTVLVNVFVSSLIFSLIPREQHGPGWAEEQAMRFRGGEPREDATAQLRMLRSEAARALDRVVELKVQLLETMAAAQKQARVTGSTQGVQLTREAVDAAEAAAETASAAANSLRLTCDCAREVEHAVEDAMERCEEQPSPGSGAECDCESAAAAPPPPAAAAAAAAASSDASSGAELPYLMLAMGTVSRREGLDYLNPTLDVILNHLPSEKDHPMHGRIRVHVMNNDEKPHAAFEKARERFAHIPEVFEFSERSGPDVDPKKPSQISAIVRKQSRDVAGFLHRVAGRSKYLLIMEDDFMLCPQALSTILYILDKASRDFPNWLTIKISYGMNGVLMHNDEGGGKDVRTFAEYLLKRYLERPPDHIYTEWAAGEKPESHKYKNGRPHMAFRYNLLHHAGVVSSLRDQKMLNFPKCFELMVYPVLFEVDAFKPALCGHTDMWPCKPPSNVPWIDEPYKKPSDKF